MLKVKDEVRALGGKRVAIKWSRQETFQKDWIAWDSDWDEHVWDQLTLIYAQAHSWFFPMQHGLCIPQATTVLSHGPPLHKGHWCQSWHQ